MRIITVLSSIVAAIVIAGCENPADNKPKAEVSVAGPDAAANTAKPAGALPLKAGSTVEFTGSKVTGSHSGGFKNVSGWATIGPDATASKVSIDIDTTSVFTDEPKLTKHLASADFFDVAKFPKAHFESTSITGTAPSYKVTGNLRLHGVSKAISFPASIVIKGKSLTAVSEFAINRKDFGILYKGKADDLIRDEVVIKFNVSAGG